MEDNKKKGLGMVLEGVGMRGLYTAGVLDELMEQGIYADSTVGVSAGAIFGCNYKSRQIGRTLRYNTRFCKDKRYMGLKSWITTGDLYSKDFAYGEVPWKLDVFDTETFARSPMKFTVVCTDIETGKPCYQECRMGDRLDVEWMRASASLPLAARPVKLNGRMYLDGGISDPIPVNWMLSQGYEKNVVVCTRHSGYRKEHNKLMPLLRLKFREYPELVKLLDERHIQYNRMLDKIAYLEKEGRIHVIRPDRDISAKPVERDPAHLKEIYEVGRRVMKADMEKLKEGIELFRKAADHYEFHRMKEAEQIISDLLQKYPGHPGFMKFKCRFLMEDAGENRVEAERFLDKALKMFPEDGYFLKYKADILWMDGEMQKAAELYLQVKNKTTNGIVWMEMDRFFRGYKSEILKSCEELIANHNKKEALALMELWSRLIPEDDDIQGALYLAKTVCARTQSEIEKEIGEIRAVIGTQMITPVSVEKNPGKSRKQIKSDRTSDETSADDVNKKVSDPSAETEEVKAPADIQVKVSEEHKMYRKALTRAWKRLGYSDELAELRTQIICTGEESELEWLAEQVRNRQFRREEKACAYKLVGDVRMKQGQTREAFANYRKALEYEMPSYVRTELYRIFINDLNDGSRQAKSFGKKTDITVVLDKWLDKYESIEDIKKIVQTVTVK